MQTETRELEKPIDHANCNLLLALSGGGFRATLFHLGVLRALLDAGALQRVSHIASVSGGSILAAHALLNWERITAGPAEFEEVAEELLALIRRDVRNHVMRRLPGIFLRQRFAPLKRVVRAELSATDELQKIYSDFYGRRKLQDLLGDKRPELAILGTNVGRARLCWFSGRGFSIVSPGCTRPETVGRDVIEVADAVAASSAFPVLFPPLRFSRDELKYQEENKYQYVTDAGVYDNLALSCFIDDESLGGRGVFGNAVGPVIVSDATATIDWDSEQKPGLIQNLLRSIDIVQQRSSDLLRHHVGLSRRYGSEEDRGLEMCSGARRADTKKLGLPTYVLVDISHHVHDTQPCISDTLQRHLSSLRTDLDCFSEAEIHYLVHHGYCVAWRALKRVSLIGPAQSLPFESWRSRWPSSAAAALDHSTAAKQLQRGASRQFRIRDLGTTRVTIAAALALLVLIGVAWAAIAAWPDRLKQKHEVVQPTLGITDQNKRAEAILAYYRTNPIRTGTKPAAAGAMPAHDPDHSAFEILSIERVFDMRDWQEVSPDRPAELERTHLQATYHLRRPPLANNITFQFKTSGQEVWPWVATGLAPQFFRPVDEPIDLHYTKRWQVSVGVNSITPYTLFPLTFGATYVNAFQSGHLDAALKAYSDTEVGTLIILFPPSKRATGFKYFHTTSDSADRDYRVEPSFVRTANNGLFVQFRELRKGYSYGVEWTWETSPALMSLFMRDARD